MTNLLLCAANAISLTIVAQDKKSANKLLWWTNLGDVSKEE